MSEDTERADTFAMNENTRGHVFTGPPDYEDAEEHGNGQSGLYGLGEASSCPQDFGQFPYMRLKQRMERVPDVAIRHVKHHHRSPALWFPEKSHDLHREGSPEAHARTNVLPAVKYRRDAPAGAITCFGKPPPGKPRTRPLDDSNKCYTCGKEFPNMAKLYWHLLMHAGERSNTCHQCGKGFASKKARKRHMLQHVHEDEAYDGKVRGPVRREEAAEPTALVESQTECSIVFVEGENFEKHVYLDNPWGSEPGIDAPSRETAEKESSACSLKLEGDTGNAAGSSPGERPSKHLRTVRSDDHAYAYWSPGLERQYAEPQTADLDMDTCMESPSDILGNFTACCGDYENDEVQLLLSSEEHDQEQSPFHRNSPSNGDIDEVSHADLSSGEEPQDNLLVGEEVGDMYLAWPSQAEEPSGYLAILQDHELAQETQLSSSFIEDLETCPYGQWRSGEGGPDDVDSHRHNNDPTLLHPSLKKEPRDDFGPYEHQDGNTRKVLTSKSGVDQYPERNGNSSSSSNTASRQGLVEGASLDKDSPCQKPFGGEVQDYSRDVVACGGVGKDGVPEVNSEAEHDACPVCGRIFTSRARLSSHVLLHGTGKTLRWRHCATSFASEHLRSRHMSAHIPASGLKRAAWSKKYKIYDSLRRHISRHQCRVCHKRFSFRCHVRKHLMVHTTSAARVSQIREA